MVFVDQKSRCEPKCVVVIRNHIPSRLGNYPYGSGGDSFLFIAVSIISFTYPIGKNISNIWSIVGVAIDGKLLMRAFDSSPLRRCLSQTPS